MGPASRWRTGVPPDGYPLHRRFQVDKTDFAPTVEVNAELTVTVRSKRLYTRVLLPTDNTSSHFLAKQKRGKAPSPIKVTEPSPVLLQYIRLFSH